MKPMPLRPPLLLCLSVVLAVCLVAIPAKTPARAAADQVPDGPTKLLRFADISKDKVVFAYAGDLWITSREGGEPKRLTSHPSNDIVLGWTPDGKNILFRSDRFSAPPGRYTKLFLVSPEGGPA